MPFSYEKDRGRMQPSSDVKIPDNHPLSSTKALESFGNELLAWYDEHKRELPLENMHPSLYKTVVSEFMLQQTRVSTVLPYFDRWIGEISRFRLPRLGIGREGSEGMGRTGLLFESPQPEEACQGNTSF